ncbi:MAG: right-handed parallel beta-helix repeat-containing protein [Sorangiineae bacterium]|nr:right-handed parallel beta-helix repeat-containing protein [Polyangiaceae bacterium]MEB2323215.1 right-handed parallel beta-helix repeat-containing protein [Sorangiineae bacterium]
MGGSAGAGGNPDSGEEPDPGFDGPMDLGGCTVPGPGKLPSAALPQVTNRERAYTIELARWRISNSGGDATANTDGINAAITWAKAEGYGTIRLPAGTYRVGKKQNDAYWGGVELPSSIHFSLDDGATLQMTENDAPNYCVIEVSGRADVIISGGTVRGDRDTHPPDDDEGHAICVWGGDASERVLIEGMKLTGAAGDGILINGGKDLYSKDITVRHNEIFDCRRQAVSIVGGVDVVVEDNELHDMHGASQEFGIDIEGPRYTNQDILIRRNKFYQNQGGDYVNNDGRNVWLIDLSHPLIS